MIREIPGVIGIPVARTLAGLIAAILLAFMGDLFGRVFNLLVGYPWPLAVHQNIHLLFIGIGAGIGAYLGWMTLPCRGLVVTGTLVLVFAASIGGVHMGLNYGPGVDSSYWWSRYALDTTIHFSAAVAGTLVATVLGLIQRMKAPRNAPTRTTAWR